MKLKPLTSLCTAAAFAAAALALPLTAAPRNEMSTKKTETTATTDRKIDFGKPVRFVKNTFSRDKDEKSLKREDSKRNDGSTQFWNRDSKDESMKKDQKDKDGPLSRLLNWRPFDRDR